MKFTYETNYRMPALKDLRKHVLQSHSDDSRATVAELVRGHGFEAYVGGRHVAVMESGVRLALITSTKSPDFN
jgi:hypothetical protein